MTECKEQSWLFQDLGNRKVEVDCGGGYLSSDGGGLILRELECHNGFLGDLSGCFVDYRDQRYIEHSVQELLSQRINGLVLGYEDLNDHDHLRRDPMHGLICGKSDPLGQDRVLERDKGKAPAPCIGSASGHQCDHVLSRSRSWHPGELNRLARGFTGYAR